MGPISLFDHKPELDKIDGQAFPESYTRGQELAQRQNVVLKARGSNFNFSRSGKSGQTISDLLPHIQSIADEICIVCSMHTEQINHDPAHAFMNNGSIIKGRPSMGSRHIYGLGAESDNLPVYIVLISQGCRTSDNRFPRTNGLPVFFQGDFKASNFKLKEQPSITWEIP